MTEVAAPPRPPLRVPFFYGYVIAVCCFVTLTLSVGMGFYSYGVFMAPLQQEFGWSSAQVALAITFSSASALMAPLFGVLADRWGPRRMMLAFSPLVAASYLLRAGMTDLWQLYGLSVLASIGHSGETGVVLGMVMSRWFVRRRGRMMGLAMMGANFGGMIFAPISSLLISQLGWRTTYLIFFVLTVVVLMPMYYFLVRDTPQQLGLHPDGLEPAEPLPRAGQPLMIAAGWSASQALHTLAFWAVALGLAAGQIGFNGALLMEVPHLVNVGLDMSTASFALGLSAFFGMTGKAIFGYMTERVPARYAVMLALLFQAVGIAVLTNVHEPKHIVLFAPVFGMGFGSLGALAPLIVAQTFGLRAFGAISGGIAVVTALASAAAPVVAGLIKDATGSYGTAFSLFSLIMLAGVAVLTLATPPRESRPALEYVSRSS